jgi:hypothetical protein
VTYPNTLTFDLDVQTAPYGVVDVQAIVYLAKGAKAATVDAELRDRLARAFAIVPTDADVEAGLVVGIDFGYYLVTTDGDPGVLAWSDVENVVRDTQGVRKVDPGPSGLLLAGERRDYAIGTRSLPILGTVTILNGETGVALA